MAYDVTMDNDKIKSEGVERTISIACAIEGVSQRQLAIGLDQLPQVLNRKIKQESMRYTEAEKIANHLGYDIIWVKRKD